MRLTISLRGDFTIPIAYNRALQGYIYSIVGNEVHNKEGFKGFSFSKILGPFTVTNKNIKFVSNPKLIISSLGDIAEKIYKEILINESIVLNEKKIKVESAYLLKPEIEFDIFKTISPATVYRTQNKKTEYFNPENKEFVELVMSNLKQKHIQFYNQEPEEFDFKIIKAKGKTIGKYKGTIIEAHDIVFEITGDPKIKELAYYTGIGSKNSQGFGCIEMGI